VSAAALPADVATFLAAYIDTVEELEVLLYLHAHPLAEWNGRSVGDLVGLGPTAADAVLRTLEGRGLLAVRETPSRLYRYEPQSPALERAVTQLAVVAAQRKFAVASFLLSRRANSALRQFSNAFRLRSGTAPQPARRVAEDAASEGKEV
jgi:hypothetical protein